MYSLLSPSSISLHFLINFIPVLLPFSSCFLLLITASVEGIEVAPELGAELAASSRRHAASLLEVVVFRGRGEEGADSGI
jgi:hypothetical protein